LRAPLIWVIFAVALFKNGVFKSAVDAFGSAFLNGVE
jgi:hypothetical protein